MAGITRADVSTLIEEAYNDTLVNATVHSSTVLAAFPNINMGSKLTHLPVLATLPEAGWVSECPDNTGVKPQSAVTWADRVLVAEEIAVIIPVHEDVIADATEDILTDMATRGGEAMGKALDQAVIFGYNKPASWVSPSLVDAAASTNQTVTNVPGSANVDDLVGGINQCAETIALSGFVPDTLLASLALKYQVANLRDSLGQPIFNDGAYAGFRTFWNQNAAWNPASAVSIIVDSSRVRIGLRQDITVKFLDQATLGTGENQINLAERDMVALRLKARFAYVLGTGATSMGDEMTPVAAVVPDHSS